MNLEKTLRRIPFLSNILKEYFEHKDQIDYFKSRHDVPDELFDRFQADRYSEEYQAVFDIEQPLVSICIPTYNRAELIIGRSIDSALSQDYPNIEVIVVGDGCTDDTEKLVTSINDSRLHFENLEQRGVYPEDQNLRWMVAGTTPVNRALEIARGEFITHLDDDDRHDKTRVGKLLKFIRETKSDFVWHPFRRESPSGKWEIKDCNEFRRNSITTSSVFYHHWLKKIPWDINAYKYREPGDWNRFRKFKYLNVKAARFPEALLDHYAEHSTAFNKTNHNK